MKPPVLIGLLLLCLIESCRKDFDALRPAEPQHQFPAYMIAGVDTALDATYLIHAGSDSLIGFRKWEGIPTIAADSNGRHLFVAWYAGGSGEGPGNYVTVSVSNNNGGSWLNDQLVVYPRNSRLRFFDPCLWRDHYNNTWLFLSRSHTYWDGDGGVWAIRLSWKPDTVVNTMARHLYDGVMINKPVELTGGDRILFPVSVWGQRPTDPAKTGTFIYSAPYSNGMPAFQSLVKYAAVNVPQQIRTFDEHQLVQTSDPARLFCFVRTTKGVYYCKSMDYGKHWSVLSPFQLVGNTADSRFHISRLRSGNLMLIVNNSHTRTSMTVFLSKDDGATWPFRLLIDSRNNISYPDAIETSDGTIHMVYDRDRYTNKDILYARFTEQDVLSGNTKAVYHARINQQ